MANVTIRCVKTETEAFDLANTAKAVGKRVAVAGPTNVVRIRGDSPNLIEWDSGQNADWYVVISTEDALVKP